VPVDHSKTVHVLSMSDSQNGIGPFAMWDEVEFS